MINQGITSTVYQCNNEETHEIFAAKVYHQKSELDQLFFNEINWLEMFKHSAIIQIKDYFIQNDLKIIFLELCKYDLFDYLELYGFLNINQIKNKMKPIFEAISLIHNHDAAHCDIKIENIGIMENGDFKLIDFGSCSSIENNKSNYSGSFFYFPPEISSESRDLQKGDIWSLGITLFACATEQFPFHGDEIEYFNQVTNDEPDFYLLENIEESTDLVSLLQGMLSKSSNNRFSINDCLSHPFFLN
jgi:serine/threonine protein kinase